MKDGRTRVVEIPVPKARPGHALVRVSSSLVSSGTERMLVEFSEKSLLEKARSRPDLVKQVMDKAKREGILPTIKAAFNKLDQPMLLGYSSAGTIVGVGSDLKGFRVGDRVACAGGGHAVHAEYNVVPQNLMAKIPPNVDFDSAAFSTLGAISLNGIRLAHLGLGEKVAVIGLGLLGMITAELVRASGCQVIGIDVNLNKVKMAQKAGFHAIHRSKAEKGCASFSDNRGVDAVLICADTSSDDTVQLAGEIARDRAHVISIGVVGTNLPRKLYYEKELFFQVSRSSGPGRYDSEYEENGQDYPFGFVRWTEQRNMQSFLELLSSQRISVDHLISHRFAIEDAQEAYSLITSKSARPFIGIILTYSLQPQAEPQPPSPLIQKAPPVRYEKEVILGVLGAGNYAQATLLPIVKRSKVVLDTIVSASGISAAHAAEKYGFSRTAASDDEVLQNTNINAALIMTRHHQHASQLISALEAGKHVYCEKPIAVSNTELDRIESVLARHPENILMCGFNRRFSRFGSQMKSLAGDCEEPIAIHYRVNAGFLPSNHWLNDPAEGGRLIGEACHFVDFLTFITGQIPVSVFARGLPDQGKYSNDNFVLVFNYPNGSVGTVTYLANGDKSCPKEQVELFCHNMVIRLNDYRLLELYRNGSKKTYRDVLGQDKGHAASWTAFLASVKDHAEPPIPYTELFGVHRAIFAAKEALVSTRVVDI